MLLRSGWRVAVVNFTHSDKVFSRAWMAAVVIRSSPSSLSTFTSKYLTALWIITLQRPAGSYPFNGAFPAQVSILFLADNHTIHPIDLVSLEAY